MHVTISLPEGSECLLTKGQDVDFTTPFLKAHNAVEMTIPIGKKLKIDGTKIFKYLKKFVGEKVQKNEVIATRKSFFLSHTIVSEHDGVIKEIDHTQGVVVIKTTSDEMTDRTSYFTGEITEVDKHEVVLKTKKGSSFKTSRSSENFGGEVWYGTEAALSSVTTEDVENRVVVVDSLTPYDQAKLEAMGIRGYITVEPLREYTYLPNARLKEDDVAAARKEKHTYCVIDTPSSTIYFYD